MDTRYIEVGRFCRIPEANLKATLKKTRFNMLSEDQALVALFDKESLNDLSVKMRALALTYHFILPGDVDQFGSWLYQWAPDLLMTIKDTINDYRIFRHLHLNHPEYVSESTRDGQIRLCTQLAIEKLNVMEQKLKEALDLTYPQQMRLYFYRQTMVGKNAPADSPAIKALEKTSGTPLQPPVNGEESARFFLMLHATDLTRAMQKAEWRRFVPNLADKKNNILWQLPGVVQYLDEMQRVLGYISELMSIDGVMKQEVLRLKAAFISERFNSLVDAINALLLGGENNASSFNSKYIIACQSIPTVEFSSRLSVFLGRNRDTFFTNTPSDQFHMIELLYAQSAFKEFLDSQTETAVFLYGITREDKSLRQRLSGLNNDLYIRCSNFSNVFEGEAAVQQRKQLMYELAGGESTDAGFLFDCLMQAHKGRELSRLSSWSLVCKLISAVHDLLGRSLSSERMIDLLLGDSKVVNEFLSGEEGRHLNLDASLFRKKLEQKFDTRQKRDEANSLISLYSAKLSLIEKLSDFGVDQDEIIRQQNEHRLIMMRKITPIMSATVSNQGIFAQQQRITLALESIRKSLIEKFRKYIEDRQGTSIRYLPTFTSLRRLISSLEDVDLTTRPGNEKNIDTMIQHLESFQIPTGSSLKGIIEDGLTQLEIIRKQANDSTNTTSASMRTFDGRG